MITFSGFRPIQPLHKPVFGRRQPVFAQHAGGRDVFFASGGNPADKADSVLLKNGAMVSLKESDRMRDRIYGLMDKDGDAVFSLWARAKNPRQAVPPPIERKLIHHGLMEPDNWLDPVVSQVVLASFSEHREGKSTTIRWVPHPYEATLEELAVIRTRGAEISDDITMRTGDRVSYAVMTSVRQMIYRLLNADKMGEGANLSCFHLWHRARNPDYAMDKSHEETLKTHGLLDKEGRVPSQTAAIILASFDEVEPNRFNWVEAGRVPEESRQKLIRTIQGDSLEAVGLLRDLSRLGDAGLETMGIMALMGLAGEKIMDAYRLAGDLPGFMEMLKAYDPMLVALARAPEKPKRLALPGPADSR